MMSNGNPVIHQETYSRYQALKPTTHTCEIYIAIVIIISS